MLLGVVSLVLYRNWRYEQELDSLLWKIDFKDIQMHENDKEKENNGQKLTRVSVFFIFFFMFFFADLLLRNSNTPLFV